MTSGNEGNACLEWLSAMAAATQRLRDALKQDPSKIVGAIEEALRLRLPFFGDGAAREIYAGFARARGPAARGGRPG